MQITIHTESEIQNIANFNGKQATIQDRMTNKDKNARTYNDSNTETQKLKQNKRYAGS